MAKTDKKRRLKNIRVDEISLVDEPAVPKAKFVIAKRDAGEQPVSDENGTTEGTEDVTKADKSKAVGMAFRKAIDTLRAAAKDMDPEGLSVLANVMGYAQWAFSDQFEKSDGDTVRPHFWGADEVEDLKKQIADLKAPEQTEEPPEETTEPVEKTEEPQPSQLDEAGEELAKRSRQQQQEAEAAALAKINDLSSKFSATLDRMNKFGDSLRHATGKVGD